MDQRVSRIASAFKQFQPPRGRGHKLWGFRKSMSYDFLIEIDDLIAEYRRRIAESKSPRYSHLERFLDEFEQLLPPSDFD